MQIKPHHTTSTLYGLLQIDDMMATQPHKGHSRLPTYTRGGIKKRGAIRGIASKVPRDRGVWSHTRNTLATMSEGASAGSTAAQASHASQACAGGSSRSLRERLSMRCWPRRTPPHKKGKYPEPDFPIERSGAAGREGSYLIRFKLKLASTRVVCADGKCVSIYFSEHSKSKQEIKKKNDLTCT